MGKLHEVLAVERELESTTKAIVEEATLTFNKKVDHFNAYTKTLEMLDAERKSEEDAGKEVKELTDTVKSKLEYVATHLIKSLDCTAQKEFTNTRAKADVILEDGKVILSGVPATLLLSLENRLSKLYNMYKAIPTQQPGVTWEPAPDLGPCIFKAKEKLVANKTEKTTEYRVLYEATKEHPAQIEKWVADKVVGKYTTYRTCSMISPATKSALLGRLDSLIHAIKQARMRANEEEVISNKIGKELIDYLHQDL